MGVASVHAQIAMPDPALIHGRAIPASELPAGTITVRVVREAIGNNLQGEEVRLTIAGTTRMARTDDQGRAEFAELPPGTQGRAEATVQGEALVSEPFTVPATGGLRVILVSGLKDAAARAEREAATAAAAPAVPGAVVFSPNSRVLMEFRDDTLQVFYVLDIVNTARTSVDIGGPLILDLPTGAAGASILQGSSPNAIASGDRVTITGPFPPGSTTVQVAFRLRHSRSDLTFQQTWPATVEQLTVAIQRLGAVTMSSPQFSTVGEVRAESGTPFLLASGPRLPAGSTLTVQLSNLPVHSAVPRNVALGLAAIILAAGLWFAFGRGAAPRPRRPGLQARRDALIGEVAALEARRRAGDSIDEVRRQRLLAELEQIDAELDEAHTPPRGGGEDLAA